MSKLIKREDFTEMVELWTNSDDKKVGTFQKLECIEHGTEWSFTDKYGTDICIECVKDMCEPEVNYTIPGFENLEESLEKFTIRKAPKGIMKALRMKPLCKICRHRHLKTESHQ